MASSQSPWSSTITVKTEKKDPNEGTPVENLLFYENFQDIPVGSPVDTYTDLSQAGSGVISSEQSHPDDDRSMVTTILSASDGFGEWGWEYGNLPPLKEGGELWVRVMSYYPDGFDFSSSNGDVGGIKIYRGAPDGTASIPLHLAITSNGGRTASMADIVDGSVPISGAQINTGVWETWELYVKIDSTSGVVQLWKDGVRILEETAYPTLADASHVLQYVTFDDRWPGGSPATQSNFIAQVAIAARGTTGSQVYDDTPNMTTDDYGYPFIGLATQGSGNTPPPVDPPTNGTRLGNIYYYENFQEVPLNANPEAYTAITSCATALCVSNEKYAGDDRSIRTTIDQPGSPDGSGGYGRWGFQFTTGGGFPRLSPGGELWIRIACFYPDDFSFNNGKHTKFKRVHKSVDGENNGYIDTYLEPSGAIKYIVEYPGPGGGEWKYAGKTMPKGRWVMIEHYYQLNTTGGTRRMWMDGELVNEHVVGMSDRTNWLVDALFFLTYWDANLPKVQSMYFSQLAVAVKGTVQNGGYINDTEHMDTDAAGNFYIGMATQDSSGSTMPAPTNFRVASKTSSSMSLSWDYGTNSIEGFEIAQKIDGRDTSWRLLAQLDSSARSYSAGGLPASTSVGHRIRGGTLENPSDWVEVFADTESGGVSPPGGTDLSGLVSAGGFYEDFSTMPVGSNPKDHNSNITECNNATVVSGEFPPYGIQRSARTWIAAGQEGFGDWGFGITGQPPLNVNGEIWMRLACKFPVGFNPRTDTGRLKWFRIYRAPNTSSVQIMVGDDFEVVIGAGAQSPEPPGWETGWQGDGKWIHTGTFVKPGQWQMFEAYVKLNQTPYPGGTGGSIKLWVDGKFIGEHTKMQTQPPNSVGSEDYHRIHTNWNSGSPATQEHWLTHFTFGYRGNITSGGSIDTTPYMDRDENGFPFIGMATRGTGSDTNLSNITYYNNFERYNSGETLEYKDGLRTCDNATCDTSMSYPGGTRCMRTWIAAGNEGETDWGKWGFRMEFLNNNVIPKLEEGAEIWWRMAVFYPQGFNFSTGVYGLKSTRFRRVRKSDEGNLGYIDEYIRETGELTSNVEGDNADQSWYDHGDGIVRGEWVMIEKYVKFSRDAPNQKLWKNGIKIGDWDDLVIGVGDPDVRITELLWHTIWNNGANYTQEHWADQLAVAVRGPTSEGVKDDTADLDKDADGFPFIGMTVENS